MNFLQNGLHPIRGKSPESFPESLPISVHRPSRPRESQIGLIASLNVLFHLGIEFVQIKYKIS